MAIIRGCLTLEAYIELNGDIDSDDVPDASDIAHCGIVSELWD